MTKMKATDKKIRFTIDLSPEFYQRFKDLKALVGAESKASLIRDALQLYEYIAKETKEGGSFILKKGEKESTISFFKLSS